MASAIYSSLWLSSNLAGWMNGSMLVSSAAGILKGNYFRRRNSRRGGGAALVTTITTVASRNWDMYLPTMKLAEIEQEALALPDRERALLAAKLLDTLPPPGTDVSDDEIERRERELESGQVSAISHEEFVRRVQQGRGR